MALTKERMTRTRFLSSPVYPLDAGTVAYKGGLACVDTGDNTVKPGAASTTLVPIGTFAESVDATGGSKPVRVDLANPRFVHYFKSGTTTDAITIANIFDLCYIIDDETVGLTNGSSTRSVAGRIVDIASDGLIGVDIQDRA